MALWPNVTASPSLRDAKLDNECLAMKLRQWNESVPTGDRLREVLERTLGPIDGLTQKVVVKFIQDQYGIGRGAARDMAKTALGERKPGPVGKQIVPNNCAE